MAVTKIYKQLTQPMGFSATDKSFTETWLVHLDDPKTPLKEIEAHRDYPIRFETHADNPTYYCLDAKCEQPLQSPNIRPLIVNWSNVIPKAYLVDGKPKYDDDPTKRPVDIEWGIYTSQKTIRMAYDDNVTFDPKKPPPVPKKPIVTTAGEPIFMQIPVELRAINFMKNVTEVPRFMAKAGMITNSDTVKIAGIPFEPNELLAGGLNIGKPMFAHGKVYYEFSWYFLVALDADGWVEKRRNAGYHEKVRTYFIDGVEVSYNTWIQTGPGSYTATDALRQIHIGPVQNRHFPSAPVLITPGGRAYRARAKGDPDDIEKHTGEILTTQSKTGQGITPAQWEKAELKFKVRIPIPFNKWFPLR